MARIVAVSGSLHVPSRTRALLDAILVDLGDGPAEVIEVTEIDGLGSTFGRGPLPPAVASAVDAITGAELLVVATPVYRASYTGLLKHLIDLVPQDALRDTVVLLAATGGDNQHSLVIEHELRPLFGFFGAVTAPEGVYARSDEIVDGAIGGALAARIFSAARRARALL